MRNISTVIVTGGARFTGSAVIRQFINKTDSKVVNVDALTYTGNLESLESVSEHPHYFFEHTDICNKAAMERICREYKPDTVMHLAAESHVEKGSDPFSRGERVAPTLTDDTEGTAQGVFIC